MTFDQLEMIEAVIEEGSYQAAAERLHKSQPSISVGIKKIEQEYGVALFSREQYRSQLTPQGRLFFSEAKKTLQSFRKLDALGQELGQGIEAEIKIAVDPLLRICELSEVFSLARSQNPRLSFILDVKAMEDAANAVETHDLCIGTWVPRQTQVEALKFCHVDLVPAISKKITAKRIATSQQLLPHPQIVLRSQDNPDGSGSEPWATPWFVNEHSLKEELIRQGLGWGRLPKSLIVEENKQLQSIPHHVVKRRNIELYLMRHSLKPHGPIAQYIWAHHLRSNRR